MKTSLCALKTLYRAIGSLEWQQLQLSTATAVLTVLSSTGLMAFSSYIISFAAMRPDVSEILVAVTAVRFFGIARAVLRYTERMTAHNTVFRLLSRLRVQVYKGVSLLTGKQLLTLDRDLAFNTLTADIESLQDFYLRTFMPVSISIIIGIVSTLFIAFWHPLQAILFALLYVGAHLGAAWLVHQKTHGHSASLLNEVSNYRSLFTDYAEGIAEVQTNGRSDDYQNRLDSAVHQMETLGMTISLWRSVGAWLQQTLLHLTVLAALITGALWVADGKLSGVYLAAIALCCFTLFESAPGVMTCFQKVESSGKSAENILHLMNAHQQATSEMAFEASAPDLPSSLDIQTLTLQNASFSYDDTRQVLHNIHLELKRGQRIAVVGASGSGKSTLLGLLTGLLPLDQGLLLVNEVAATAQQISQQDQLFAVVDQSVYLFNRSLRDNLLLGNPSASDDDLGQALNQAGLLQELLEATNSATITDVLNTSTGLAGRHLSGGQRQRVAIARALLKHAPFLLIDEPMAGLDLIKEEQILKTLFSRPLGSDQHTLHNHSLQQGILWITHRLILMEEMDLIHVLHEGHMVEQGTHSELMALNGHYAKMMAVQEDMLN